MSIPSRPPQSGQRLRWLKSSCKASNAIRKSPFIGPHTLRIACSECYDDDCIVGRVCLFRYIFWLGEGSGEGTRPGFITAELRKGPPWGLDSQKVPEGLVLLTRLCEHGPPDLHPLAPHSWLP